VIFVRLPAHQSGSDQANISPFKDQFSRNRYFSCLEAVFGLEIIAVRSLGFAETGFLIRSGNPSSLRLHPRFALYDLDKVLAPDGNALRPLAFPDLSGPARTVFRYLLNRSWITIKSRYFSLY